MKKKILSLAVAAGLVGAVSAQAEMHINPNGLGEALIYPFYSAVDGNDTLVSIVNTTGLTKAVKVRFIEALNSQEVFDFNLYLSPEDVWTGVITANPRGDGAIIRTADTSCTVPQLGLNAAPGYPQFNGWIEDGVRNQPFVNYKYGVTGKDPYNPTEDLVPDAAPFRGLDRTLEGYIEVIEMGQLAPDDEGFGQAAVHTPAGVPNDCQALVDAWTQGGDGNGTWLTDSQVDLLQGEDGWAANAGGLYGYGVVVNVPEGTAVGYDAIAIDGFNSDEALANLHFQPGYETPSLQNANEMATIFDGTEAVEAQFGSGADAVSALFMSTSIANDYVIDPSINANTDWVITMPTKRFYVQGSNPVSPFTSTWATSEATGTSPAMAGACEQIVYRYWDREEANIAPVDVVNPPLPSPLPPFIPEEVVGINLCTEVTVVSFGEDSALNASERIRLGLSTGDYTEGWARINFDNLPERVLPSLTGGVELSGLPVVGFAVFEYQNGALDGVLSNYGSSATHKSEVGITVD